MDENFETLGNSLLADIDNSGDILLTYAFPNIDDIQVFPFKVLDDYQRRVLESSIVFGVSIGACSVILLLLFVVSYNNRKKKLFKSFLFNLNAAILLVYIIQSGLNLNYLMSRLSSPSFFITGAYYGESFAMTDTANAFRVILVGLVQISLTYQVYIIFKGHRLNIWSVSATLFSTLFSITVVAFTINSVVLAHRKNSAFTHGQERNFVSLWNDLPVWLFSININIMSVLLILKLGMAIRTRRYLGLKQFDGLHILVIMSTQTLIIPSIILFVHYFGISNVGSMLVKVSMLLIVLTLPLTSLWAQTQNNTENINSSPSMSFIRREISTVTTFSNNRGGNTSNLEKKPSSTVQGIIFPDLSTNPGSALPSAIEQLLGEGDDTISNPISWEKI
ncbi:uncharacterized protein SPAPADRAFT_133541 [Spathaspora passalidarum NRRL Y-27907]|uniref:Pheromone alpha factor receptor n=1 Tax=Spathaspora passalidarum (strain NRRL Y-27907 / 11-Y1) TaxID=619300 RepID=G3AJU2_SPAPN|nr:uncharacterized protein SPAPADRAFT_133541 [Spathaspora passalidarum NRRL Y-27907]EGW33993.1 hypothetical protein SPAPADRAFT_133541 [Spathaspora passalidarum NRRL Y-27907]